MAQHRRRRSGHGGRRLKRLLIVGIVLGVLAVVGLGVRHFLHSGLGQRQQERANRAHAAMKAGDFNTARLLLEPLVDELPGKLGLRQNLIVCYLQLERYEDARKCAKEALGISPSYAPAHLTLSKLLAERDRDFVGAIYHAREAVAGREVPAGARLYLADLLLRSGRLTEAVATLTEAVQEDESADGAMLRLAPLLDGAAMSERVAEMVRRRVREYLVRAKEELETAPDDAQQVAICVRLAMLAGKQQEAIEILERVEQTRALTPREVMMHSAAESAAGNLERAKEQMTEATAASDGESALTPEEAALGWLRAGEPARALSTAESGLEKSPQDITLHRIRVRALWQLMGSDEAAESPRELYGKVEDAATKLLEILPTDEEARRIRGLVRLERGAFPGALDDAKELERIAPRSPSARWILGLACLQVGMPRLALDHLEAGRLAAPTPESASRWILRAAVRVGDAEVAERESTHLVDARDAALRAAARAIGGDLDAAEAVEGREGFRRCPVEDRVLLALVLAPRGRPALAVSLAEELEPLSDHPGVALQVAQLLLAAGERERANAAFEKAAKGGGTAGIRALLVLGEQAVLAKPPDDAAVSAAVARLREIEGGEPFARLLEGRAALAREDSDEALAAAREAEKSSLPLPAARVLVLAALQQKGVTGEELETAAGAVLEIDPGNRAARAIRANALLRGIRAELGRGELREAEDRATEFLELQPELAGAQMLRGMIRSQLGDANAAEEDAQALIESEESRGAGYFLLGVIRSREGALEAALSAFRRAVEATPDSPAALTALGLTLVSSGRPEEALQLADRCLEVDEEGSRALTIRVGALVALKRYPEAAAELEKRLSRKPEDLRARLLHGWVLMLAGQPARAASDFEEVVRKAPKLPMAHSFLVAAELGAGRPEKARAAADAATREGLELVGILLRAEVVRAGGGIDEELSILTEAVEKFPESPAALEALGSRLLDSGNTKAGADHLRRAAVLAPRNVAIRMRLGLLAEREGRITDAVRWYEEILALQPGNVVAANNLAYRLIEDPATREEAIRLAKMATERVPTEGEFFDTLALALSAAGKHAEAVRAAEAAMRLLPARASVAVTAARVYQAAGRQDDARWAASKAQENAEDAERESILRQIRDLRLGTGK